MRASDLMMKRVINVVDGIALGEVIDYDIDNTKGTISAFIIEQIGKKKNKGHKNIRVKYCIDKSIEEVAPIRIKIFGKNNVRKPC